MRMARSWSCLAVSLAAFGTAFVSQEKALKLLGLEPREIPDKKEVKRAFRRKVAMLHPDLRGGESVDL